MTSAKTYFAGFLALLFFSLPQVSRAGACITSFSATTDDRTAWMENFTDQAQIYPAALTCQDLDVWKMGLRAATYTFSVTSLALACTQVGAPVAVGMFGVGTVLYTAELVIDNLPCVEATKEETEKLVRQEVCQTLKAQGIQCDPKKLVKDR